MDYSPAAVPGRNAVVLLAPQTGHAFTYEGGSFAKTQGPRMTGTPTGFRGGLAYNASRGTLEVKIPRPRFP